MIFIWLEFRIPFKSHKPRLPDPLKTWKMVFLTFSRRLVFLFHTLNGLMHGRNGVSSIAGKSALQCIEKYKNRFPVNTPWHGPSMRVSPTGYGLLFFVLIRSQQYGIAPGDVCASFLNLFSYLFLPPDNRPNFFQCQWVKPNQSLISG